MRDALAFDLEARRRCSSWMVAFRHFIGQGDALGVLVMISGVAGGNTHRGLDPQGFRGFAVVDLQAPLGFVNGADTKAAQVFTFAHELDYVWLGESVVSDADARATPYRAAERWCNRVAAELLVPVAVFRQAFDQDAPVERKMSFLARRFKVSSLAILRRLYHAGRQSREVLWTAYDRELKRLQALPKGSGDR